jgi:DNA adenine methylase
MTYPGGKNGSGVYQTIINQMPPHKIYVEGFLGSGAVMRAKRPAPVANIGIDSDAAAIQQFAVVSNPVLIPWLRLLTGNAIDWIASDAHSTCQSKSTLVYLDPPYLMSTRRQHRPIYRCELADDDHRLLLDVIRDLPCMVMISGYWSEMYANALQGWRTVQFQTITRGGSMATEWLWMNYPEPFELHDYRYLGENFRQRERIKRKKSRWLGKLQNMPPLERYAVLSALADLHSPADSAGNGDAGSARQL